MTQSKDALSNIFKSMKKVRADEEKTQPTDSWKENLMEDIRKQTPPQRPASSMKPLLIVLFLAACSILLYLLVFR